MRVGQKRQQKKKSYDVVCFEDVFMPYGRDVAEQIACSVAKQESMKELELSDCNSLLGEDKLLLPIHFASSCSVYVLRPV